MIPQEIVDKWLEFAGAVAVLSGAMAWWRKGGVEEDVMVAKAADTVLDILSDADTVSRVDLHTGRNLRDQLTVGEAVELDRERELRRFARRN